MSTKSTRTFAPYIQAAMLLPEVLADDNNNSKNLFAGLNANTFWYLINSQYFPDAHLSVNQQKENLKETSKQIKKFISTFTLPQRFEGNKKEYNGSKFLQEWRNSELLKATEIIKAFFTYCYNYETPMPKQLTVKPKRRCKIEDQMQQTSLMEDYSFINSTVNLASKLLKNKLENQESYRLLANTYIDSALKKPFYIQIPHPKVYQILDYQGGLQPCGLVEVPQQEDQQPVKIAVTRDHLIRSIVLDLPLDIIISMLEESLPVYEFPDPQIPSLEHLFSDSDDIANLTGTHTSQDDVMIRYMKKKQCQRRQKLPFEDVSISGLLEQSLRQEDLQCQICFSGEYEDNNLILICSLCNIAMHQLCIYQEKIPQDNWFCKVCEIFGASGINLPCLLCSKKGGAMLPSHIKTDLLNCYNKEYSAYLQRNPSLGQSEAFVTEKMRSACDLQLIYHYFKEKTYSSEEPIFSRVWVHYSCVEVHDQCFFSLENDSIFASGLESLSQNKFDGICEICNKVSGVTAKCREAGCSHHYHAECARRLKMVSEEYDKSTVYFRVFCPLHRPFELERQFQSRRKKARQDIKKFTSKIVKSLSYSRRNAFNVNDYFRQISQNIHPKSTLNLKRDPLSLLEHPFHHKKLTFQDSLHNEQKMVAQKNEDVEFFTAVIKKLKEKFVPKNKYQPLPNYSLLSEIIGNKSLSLWKKMDGKSGQSAYQRFIVLKSNSLHCQKLFLQLENGFQKQGLPTVELIEKVVKRSHHRKKPMSEDKDDKEEKEQKRYFRTRNGIKKQANIEEDKAHEHQKTAQSRVRAKKDEDGDQNVIERDRATEGRQKWCFNTPQKPHKNRKHKQSQCEKSLPIIIKVKRKIIKKQNKDQIKKEKSSKGKENVQIEEKAEKITKKSSIASGNKQQSHRYRDVKDSRLRRGTAEQKDLILYCTCREPYDEDRAMLACNRCDEWFHFSCIGFKGAFNRAQKVQFVCLTCLGHETKKKRSKYLSSYVGLFKKDAEILNFYKDVPEVDER